MCSSENPSWVRYVCPVVHKSVASSPTGYETHTQLPPDRQAGKDLYLLVTAFDGHQTVSSSPTPSRQETKQLN